MPSRRRDGAVQHGRRAEGSPPYGWHDSAHERGVGDAAPYEFLSVNRERIAAGAAHLRNDTIERRTYSPLLRFCSVWVFNCEIYTI